MQILDGVNWYILNFARLFPKSIVPPNSPSPYRFRGVTNEGYKQVPRRGRDPAILLDPLSLFPAPPNEAPQNDCPWMSC